MKKKLILTIWAVACLALAPAAFAQLVNVDQTDNSKMYVPTVPVATQSTLTGTVGGVFYTPYYYNVTVNYLGYADPTDAPLAISHTVSIWTDGTENIVAQAVVPAGTPTLWANGYAWVHLSSAVTLTYQHYYAIGATVANGVDPWGDLIYNTTGTGQDLGTGGEVTWNVAPNGYGSGNQYNGPFVQANTGYMFAKVGAYTPGTTDPDDSLTGGVRAGNPDSIYSAPNMGYNIISTVPEPTSLALAGLGAATLLGLLKKKS